MVKITKPSNRTRYKTKKNSVKLGTNRREPVGSKNETRTRRRFQAEPAANKPEPDGWAAPKA